MKKGLGRGLESLIPKNSLKVNPKFLESVFYVEVSNIRPNAKQPRTDFDREALNELASSIKKYGILQPLLVSKVETASDRGLDVQYEVIAGERRLRAAKLAGLPHVPVIIKDNFDEERIKLEVALVENLQREDLNPIEAAIAYQRLSKDFGLTQKEVAEKVGKSRESVTNTIRLLGLPTEVREAVRSGKVSHTQARTLLAFKDVTVQKDMFKRILGGNVAVRDLEHSAQTRKDPAVNPVAKKKFIELEKNLTQKIGAPVFIKSSSNGGSLVIKFANLEELNKIAETLLG